MNWLKMLVVIGIVSAGIMLPAHAAEDSDVANITANIEEELIYLEITAVGDISDWILTPNSVNVNSTSIDLIVDTNSYWEVIVRDNDYRNSIGDKGNQGQMESWNRTTELYTGTALGSWLWYRASNATWEGEWVTEYSYEDRPILASGSFNIPGTYNISVSQTTSASDVALEEPEVYRYVILFEGILY